MLNIAICDDEAQCRAEISDLLKAYADHAADQEIAFTPFASGEALLESAGKTGGYDVYILDIIMPRMNGIQLGVELRKLGHDGKIIYLTSSREYAMDSFQARPFDYILKPFDQAAFCATLHEALASVSAQKSRSIIVRTRESSIRLSLDSILYAELNCRAILYHLTGGKTVKSIQIRTTFTEAIQELLKDRHFVLCGASMAANLHHITAVETEALVFRETHRAYLGKKACREVRSVWYDYHFDGEGSK